MAWYDPELAGAIKGLQGELKASREQRQTELEWFKSQLGSATKRDLDQAKEEILMKISELKGDVAANNAKIFKAFAEIRKRIDDADESIKKLTEQLSDVEVPAEATAELDNLRTLTQQLDDIVPDLPELPPSAGGTGPEIRGATGNVAV